jgi:hypothetical protein
MLATSWCTCPITLVRLARANTSSSTSSSWSRSSAGPCESTKPFITGTESGATTGPRTLNSGRDLNHQASGSTTRSHGLARSSKNTQRVARPSNSERPPWRWRGSNPRAQATDWVFSGRSLVDRSRLWAPTGGAPIAQPGCDVPQRPPGGTVEVSLLTTPIPRSQAARGGRLLNVLSSERVVVFGACVCSGV